ncbi:MAG TPA: hypothetical protein VFZ33_19070 [Chitinophagaceae bacterium]
MTLFIYEGFGQKALMCYFALLLMKNVPQPYSFFHRVSAIMMIVALSWLTVSAPFVYEQQQKIAKENNCGFANLPIAGTEEEANPFSGSTEEKAPKTLNTFSEEYLHDHHQSEYFLSIASQFHKGEDATTYIAYHGELLVPPPNKS